MKNSNRVRGTVGKTPWRKSLYARLALAFIVIVGSVALAQTYILAYFYRPLVALVDQQINWNLAATLAERIQPHLRNELDKEMLERRLYRLVTVNPRLDLYILNSQGEIIAEASPIGGSRHTDTVPMAPIAEFLREEIPFRPIFGRDPREPLSAANEAQRAISVAPIQLGDVEGYLYVVLETATYRYLMRASGQVYIAAAVLVGTIVIISFAVLFGAVVFRYLTRNLSALKHSVERFENGDFSSRVEIRADDEIGALSRAVNLMADTIEQQTVKLRETDRLRREFIANISHDLRSPLTTMQGFVETLARKESQLDVAEQRRYLALMKESVRLQRQLVDDLFELSKLEARERTPEFEPGNLGELAQDIFLQMQPLAERRSISSEQRIDQRLAFVSFDALLLERVLRNLISNAIQYTPEGGTLRLEVKASDIGVLVAVENSGPGIPGDELAYIFDAFYRLAKDRNRHSGGSGLGLAIVRKILELHQAEIHVSSEVGVSTRFWFELRAAIENSENQESGEENQLV